MGEKGNGGGGGGGPVDSGEGLSNVGGPSDARMADPSHGVNPLGQPYGSGAPNQGGGGQGSGGGVPTSGGYGSEAQQGPALRPPNP